MPIYEYSCLGCGNDFEILLRGSEEPECPSCGGKRLEKQLSVPAAHSAASSRLPVCQSCPSDRCDVPECGPGGCPMMG